MTDNVTLFEEARARRGRKNKSAAAPPPPREPRAPKEWTIALPVKRTEEERRERSVRLAEAVTEIEDLEAEKKDWVARQTANIKERKSETRGLARAVRTGEEKRDVLVVERFVYNTNSVDVIRTDTGECLETRPMDAAERQTELALEVNQPSFDVLPGPGSMGSPAPPQNVNDPFGLFEGAPDGGTERVPTKTARPPTDLTDPEGVR